MASADDVQPSKRDPLCTLCEKPFANPKVLKCLHPVCLGCLPSCQVGDTRIVCPHEGCSEHTTTTAIDQLPTHYLAEHEARLYERATQGERDVSCSECSEEEKSPATSVCLDCRGAKLCSFHVKNHKRSRSTQAHRVVNDLEAKHDVPLDRTVAKRSSKRCLKHPAMELILFCKSCHQVICHIGILAAKHQGHREMIEELEETAGYTKNELQDQSKSVSQHVVPRLRDSLKSVKQTMNSVNVTVEALSAEIEADVKKVSDWLKKKEEALLLEVDKDRWEKLKQLEGEEQRLQNTLCLAERGVELVEESMKVLPESEVVQLAPSIEQCLSSVQQSEAGAGWV